MRALRVVGSLLVLVAASSVGAQAPSADLDSYVLFATNDMRSRALVVTDGNVGVNAPGGQLFSAFGLHAPLSDVAANRVRIPQSECRTLFTNTAPLRRCGTSQRFASPFPNASAVSTACGFPSPFPACGGADVTVDAAHVFRLQPGRYNNIVVHGGVLPGRLILLGGRYEFCSLKSSRNADILFDSASQVFIDGDLAIAGMNFAGSGGDEVGAQDIRFFVRGTSVSVSPRARVFGRLCAPNAKMKVRWGAKLFGSFVAQTIRTDRITVRGLPAGVSGTTTTTTTQPVTTSTSTTTTTRAESTSTSTTTTTRPGGVCGNGIVDPGEACDPPGGLVCPSPSGAFLACAQDCFCPRPVDLRCCLPPSPSGAFGDCELLKPSECAALGGVIFGIGSCEPDLCTVISVPTTTRPATTSTSTTTTTRAESTSTSTTTTTRPAGVCGNGIVDPGEACDPPGGLVCPSPGGAFLACGQDCFCALTVDLRCCLRPSPSGAFGDCELLKASECAAVGGVVFGTGSCEPDPCTGISVPTTIATTTLPSTTTTATARPSTTTTSTTSPRPASTTTTTPTAPAERAREVCGNCLDDDGNGATDFEDAACCAGTQRFDMTLRNGRIRPRGATSALKLRSTLAPAGLTGIDPQHQDVFVQIRSQSGQLLCAHVPAAKFKRKQRGFLFSDRHHRLASAMGLEDMTIKVRRDGKVTFRAHGRRVRLSGAGQGILRITVGFRDAAQVESTNRCSAVQQRFRTGSAGALLAP